MSTNEMGHSPELEPAFAVEVQVLIPYTVGDTGASFRRIVPIVGGRAFGPRLSGTVLPVGADWSLVRPDGVTEVHARYAIRTDQGDIVDIVNAGLMHGLPARDPEPGEDLEEPSLFCRTSPRFEASASALRWLNDEVFVGTYGPGTDAAQEGDFTVRVDFFTVR
ncbi:DUF3237 family protein [Nocardioides sp.]|uniref:DUF3237 family protein n=1 Tax=Nocardioides sp. TaxID=35761 RepID=UPI002B83F53A|nr:DUF3237 family protein [Nocardioides sp.]HXH77180.1 DUF3237 family protein [Nocardioides sp.]